MNRRPYVVNYWPTNSKCILPVFFLPFSFFSTQLCAGFENARVLALRATCWRASWFEGAFEGWARERSCRGNKHTHFWISQLKLASGEQSINRHRCYFSKEGRKRREEKRLMRMRINVRKNEPTIERASKWTCKLTNWKEMLIIFCWKSILHTKWAYLIPHLHLLRGAGATCCLLSLLLSLFRFQFQFLFLFRFLFLLRLRFKLKFEFGFGFPALLPDYSPQTYIRSLPVKTSY